MFERCSLDSTSRFVGFAEIELDLSQNPLRPRRLGHLPHEDMGEGGVPCKVKLIGAIRWREVFDLIRKGRRLMQPGEGDRALIVAAL